MWCKKWSIWTSGVGVGQKIRLRLLVLFGIRLRLHPKTSRLRNPVPTCTWFDCSCVWSSQNENRHQKARDITPLQERKSFHSTSGNALHKCTRPRKFKYLGIVFTSDEKQTRDTDAQIARLVHRTPFYVISYSNLWLSHITSHGPWDSHEISYSKDITSWAYGFLTGFTYDDSKNCKKSLNAKCCNKRMEKNMTFCYVDVNASMATVPIGRWTNFKFTIPAHGSNSMVFPKICGLVKQPQFEWVSPIRVHKMKLSNSGKLSVFRSIFLPILPVVMNLGQWPKECHKKYKWQRWNFLRRIHDVTLRDKIRSCEIRKALNFDAFLRIEKPHLRWFSHVTRKSQRRLTRRFIEVAHTGKRPNQRLIKDKVSWLHLRPGVVAPWCGASRTSRGCWKSRGASWP